LGPKIYVIKVGLKNCVPCSLYYSRDPDHAPFRGGLAVEKYRRIAEVSGKNKGRRAWIAGKADGGRRNGDREERIKRREKEGWSLQTH